MAERKELDPYKGAFRWAYLRARFDLPRGVIVGFVALPLAAAVVSAANSPKSGASLRVRIEAGAIAGLITLGVVALLIVITALLLASKEQRDALKRETKSLNSTIEQRTEEVATLRSQRLDTDHEEGIKEILRLAQELVKENQRVEFNSPGARDSLVGHVSTIIPFIDDWNNNALGDFIIADRLSNRRDQEIGGFDRRIYSPAALEEIFDFALHRSTTPQFGTPRQIPWAEINKQAPEEVRIRKAHGEPMFAARSNHEVTREQAMERIQRFQDDILSWPDTAAYGDVSRMNAMGVSKMRLLSELSNRIAQHGYVVGSGCSRCAR
jgi:cell division protein FtsL